MLNYFRASNHMRFDSVLFQSFRISMHAQVPSDTLLFSLYIKEEFCNADMRIHGGAINTIADILPSLHVWAVDTTQRLSTTFSLSSKFLAPAKKGDILWIKTKIDMLNDKYAFTSTEMTANGNIIALSSSQYAFLEVNLGEFYGFMKDL